MMADFLALRWTRQPQGAVEVDRNNPISNGLFDFAAPAPINIRSLYPDGAPPLSAGFNGIRWKFSGSAPGRYVVIGSPPSSQSSATIMGLFNQGNAINCFPLSSRSTSSSHGIEFLAGGANIAGDLQLRAQLSSGSLYSSTTKSGLNDGRDHVAVGVFDGTSLSFIVDGTLIGELSTPGTLSHGQSLRVASRDNTFYSGGFTLGAYWNRALSFSEVREISSAPWQLFKPRRAVIYSLPSGGAVHELAGAATAGASAAGTLTTEINLAGDAQAGAQATGDLTTGIPLAGDATAGATASGALSTQIQIAAAALVSATASGSLSTAINLAGSAAFAAVADGALTTQIRLAGDAIAAAAAEAGLSTQILLDADAQAGADASGALTTTPSGLAGDAVAGATASGALSVQILLEGSALASVLASGDLTTAGAGAELAADTTVLAIASGGLTTAINLTGSPVVSVTASGALSLGLGMSADALATVSAAAVLSTQIRMEAAAVASALAAGSLSVGTAEHGARRASWRGAARQGWTRPASVQRASRPRQYG